MLANMMLKAVPESLFTWILRTERWLQLRLQQAALRKAQAHAYRAFMQLHPAWSESLFDQYFLNTAAAPLIQRCLDPHNRPTAIEFAEAWQAQLILACGSTASMAELIVCASDFLRLLNIELEAYRVAGLATPVAASSQALRNPVAPAYVAEAHGLFAEALRDNSNIEMDWLWLAGQVSRESERRYCLERALYINPHSAIARRMLTAGAPELRAREVGVGM